LRQLALDIGLSPAPEFDTFIALGNEAVINELVGLQPGSAPVYLWGPSGCGKTHLLRALQARAQRCGQSVQWLDARNRPPLILNRSGQVHRRRPRAPEWVAGC